MNVADLIPASWPSWISSTSNSKPRFCAQRVIHAEQHLRPVLRVGAAGAGVDLADRVALVVLATEQRAQLEAIELLPDLRHPVGDLTLDGVVALFACELEQRLEIRDALRQTVDELDVDAHARLLRRDLARLFLVVPQLGIGGLRVELFQTLARVLDVQVLVRVAHAASRARQALRRSRAWRRGFSARGTSCTSCRSRRNRVRCDRGSSRPGPA